MKKIKKITEYYDKDMKALYSAARSFLSATLNADPNPSEVAARMQGLKVATEQSEKYFDRSRLCKKG